MHYDSLPPGEQATACQQVWRQLVAAADGEERISIGWAGMTVQEAIRQQTTGELENPAPGRYQLPAEQLRRVMLLVEHPPGRDEWLPGGGGLWSRDDEYY